MLIQCLLCVFLEEVWEKFDENPELIDLEKIIKSQPKKLEEVR